MPLIISDEFDDPYGRWDGFAPWDSTIVDELSKDFIGTQSHVDIRSFKSKDFLSPRPQSDLEIGAQTQWESPITQDEMEVIDTSTIESWALTTSTGVTGFVVHKITARGGWSGLQLTTVGTALNCLLTSSESAVIVDISTMNYVSMVFPDYHSFDNTSYIQFTSAADGLFGEGFDSPQVTFGNNATTMPEMKLAISLFKKDGFDLRRITGVRVALKRASAPPASQTITLMAIRAYTTAWTESALDFDTLLGVICVPVTLNGNPYTGTVAEAFQFIRGGVRA